MTKLTKDPQGVVAVFVAEDGREIANVGDFNRSSPAGYTQREAQELRAKDSLAAKVVQELSSPLLSNAIENYTARQIIDKMCDSGCRVLLVPVGYDEVEK